MKNGQNDEIYILGIRKPFHIFTSLTRCALVKNTSVYITYIATFVLKTGSTWKLGILIPNNCCEI